MNSKRKNILLLIVIFIMAYACYIFAFKPTIAMKSSYHQLDLEQQRFKDIPTQLVLLKKKDLYFDSILNKMNLQHTSIENNLLHALHVEAKKNDLKVMDFNSPHVYINDQQELNTFIFTLEGSFQDILKSIYHLEQQGNFGKVAHVNFEKKKNFRTRKTFLNATIFIQRYK